MFVGGAHGGRKSDDALNSNGRCCDVAKREGGESD